MVVNRSRALIRYTETAAHHYERRRFFGRDSDRLAKAAFEINAEVDGLPAPLEGETVDELTTRLQAANAHNASIDSTEQARTTAETRGKELAARLLQMGTSIDTLRAQLDSAEEQRRLAMTQKDEAGVEWQTANMTLTKMVRHDVAPIAEALRGHEEASKTAGRREMAVKATADAAAAKADWQTEEDALEAAREEIATLLGDAKFPVEGMSYDHEEKTLTVNGIPFAQASQGQRLCAAATIAMSGNPSIRVLFAREGSLLDDKACVQLAELAEANGFQLWLEVVDSTEEGAGIWIEDGEASEFKEASQ